MDSTLGKESDKVLLLPKRKRKKGEFGLAAEGKARRFYKGGGGKLRRRARSKKRLVVSFSRKEQAFHLRGREELLPPLRISGASTRRGDCHCTPKKRGGGGRAWLPNCLPLRKRKNLLSLSRGSFEIPDEGRDYLNLSLKGESMPSKRVCWRSSLHHLSKAAALSF